MKKPFISRLLSAVLAAAVMLIFIPNAGVTASALTEGGYEYTVSGGKATITGYDGPGGDVAIPSTLGGHTVTVVGEGAFHGCVSLTGATIPEGVTSIGRSAFDMCEALTYVVIPGSLASIGDWAFNGCTALTGASIPNSVSAIGVGAFYECVSLTNVTIPERITTISDSAFAFCIALTSATIPDSVISIDNDAFYRCTSLASLNIGNGVTTIGDGAFTNCRSLANLTIPNSVTSIGDRAFRGCESLTTVTIPDNVATIGAEAFDYCTSLASATIPGSVKKIGDDAFVDTHEDFTIRCYENSAAHAYASNNGLKSELIAGDPPEPLRDTANNADSIDTASAWAKDGVKAAIAENFVPDSIQGDYKIAITRAEFAALAVRLYETVAGKAIETGANPFTDTADVNAIKAAAIGVTTGTTATTFTPDRQLNREEAATMLSRLASAIGKPIAKQAAGPTFADKASISAWAAESVAQMQATGLMGGVGNNAFSPKGQYTREQSIITILRLYEHLDDEYTEHERPEHERESASGETDGSEYNKWLEDKKRTLDEIAVIFIELNNKELIESKLLAIHGVYFDFLNVAFSDNTIFTSDGWTPPPEYLPTERPWYISAIEGNGDIAVTEIYEDSITGEPMVSISKYIGEIDGLETVILADMFIPK